MCGSQCVDYLSFLHSVSLQSCIMYPFGIAMHGVCVDLKLEEEGKIPMAKLLPIPIATSYENE